MTDVCDGDVMEKCLQTKGLDTYGIGKVRQCLLNAGASDIAAADEARLQAEAQVWQHACPKQNACSAWLQLAFEGLLVPWGFHSLSYCIIAADCCQEYEGVLKRGSCDPSYGEAQATSIKTPDRAPIG